MKQPFVKSFHPYAMTTILFWSLAYVLSRLALHHFTPEALGFLRYAVASVALIALCLTRPIKRVKPRDIPWFLASGACGFFLYMIAFNIGTSYVTAATSSVIIASVPVLTALMAFVLLKESLKRHQWAAMAVEFAGILVLTLYGASFSANRGVLWLMLAAVLLSLYNLIQRRLTATYPPLQSTAYSIFAGTLMLSAFAPDAIRQLPGAPAQAIICVIIMGIFSSAVAYIAWAEAIVRAERTSQVSNYMFFTPLLTTLLGFLLAGEVPELPTILGGTLILAGALMFNRRPKA